MEHAVREEVRPPHRTRGLVPLVRLREGQCKWPCRFDAGVVGYYLFCGRSTDGQTYCAQHRARTCPRQSKPA